MSKLSPKVVVVMPAYNAAKTLAASFARLPKKYIDQILLVDDASSDETFSIAKKLGIKALRNRINLGYGGNLKVCLIKALEFGAEIIVEYHPDNQYDPESLPLLIQKAREGFDFALGSRFIHPKEALENKMPPIKFIANRMMSFIDSFVLGIELSEFHSGFRMYTKKMLTSISFLQNSNNYLFSFEVIVQAVFKRLRIAEVPISCRYHPEMHTANLRHSTVYAIGTFKTLVQYIISKFFHRPIGPFQKVKALQCTLCREFVTQLAATVQDPVSEKNFSIYFCLLCQNGFTHPIPTDLSPYYLSTYYAPIKSLVYRYLQFRRPAIIRRYHSSGKILDIGCGDGDLGRSLPGYSYTGIETAFSKVSNPNVKCIGVEGMREKLSSYDVVSFFESLEHIKDPVSAIRKAWKCLKKGRTLIIECPNFSSFERTIFASRWFHYDPPRHISHFTPHGLRALLEKEGFILLEQRQLFAPEYSPLGLGLSILYLISPSLNLVVQKNKSIFRGIFISILLTGLLPITVPLSFILYYFHASPILLTVARKD